MYGDHKVDPKIKATCEDIQRDVQALTVELSKSTGITYDANQVRELIQTARLLHVLKQIEGHLAILSQDKRLEGLPLSMFNQRRD